MLKHHLVGVFIEGTKAEKEHAVLSLILVWIKGRALAANESSQHESCSFLRPLKPLKNIFIS